MPSPRPRRRRRRGRGAWSVGVVEAGRAVLVATFTLGAALVQLAVALVGAPLARAWRWVRFQDRPAQLAVVAAGACLVLAWAHLRDAAPARAPADDGEVYLDSDVEALARVIRSEIGIGTAQQKVHVAWATRNLAAQRGQSIARMACSPCGRQGRGRPVSSRQLATDADRELARHVLAAPQLLDPTGGATNFINPRLQDELARSGRVPGYAGQTYKRVQRRWRTQYGWEPYYRLGPDLELWGKQRSRAR